MYSTLRLRPNDSQLQYVPPAIRLAGRWRQHPSHDY
nr:MAG TPA: hypothetical protein [Caudoviricetes sp.]